LRKDLKDMADGIEKAQADYKDLLVQANDPAISDTERANRKQKAADKNKEISDHKLAYEQYSRQAESQMQDMIQRMNGNLLTEIQEHVATQAKLGGYDFVLNTTSDAILYSKGDNDITSQVLSNLNAGATIDLAPAATNSITAPMPMPKSGP
jgi:Skp family chaperone for outer membrane proteins